MQTDTASAVAWDLARPSKPQQSETELVQSIAQGDKRAMHVLFAHHRLRVYRFALRLVADPEAAEDLVSEVFLQVWRHANTFEGRCRVSTWLLAITRNLAVSILRRRPMEKLDGGEAETIPDHADDPEAAIQKKQLRAILARCLTKLSPAHREVIESYLLPRKIDRRGRGDHLCSTKHRENSHVLRTESDRKASQRLRNASSFPDSRGFCMQTASARGAPCIQRDTRLHPLGSRQGKYSLHGSLPTGINSRPERRFDRCDDRSASRAVCMEPAGCPPHH